MIPYESPVGLARRRPLILCLLARSRILTYYYVGMGYYIFSMVAIFFEPKMKDRLQMMMHHLVTLTLLITSYVWY